MFFEGDIYGFILNGFYMSTNASKISNVSMD